MKTYFDHHFPIQQTKIKYSNRNEWINKALKNEIIERERLFIYKKKYPTQENIDVYKKFRNKNLSNQRKTERNYYKEQFELNENDIRKSWKVIKDVIGKHEHRLCNDHEDFYINSKLTIDKNQIANSFNNYFVNIGKSLAQQITSTINPLSYIDTNIHSIYIPDISKNEIITVINTLKNSAPGNDEMPASILKHCIETYIDPLTYLVNLSINQGIFPDELKIAKVLPIYKSDDKQLIQNYRPISVLPFFSKIFEKIISNHLLNFIDTNNILYDNQFGFRKNHSTTHAIITLVERVSKALDTGKIVVGVYLDLKKAFDTVDHQILLNKLYAIGIRGHIHDWFKSYLSNRTQFVYYNNTTSEVKGISHGVPQGSILGPILFIIYLNDFSRASDILFSILFADDTTVLIEGHSYNNIITVLNNELYKIDTWLQANKLTININKTHYMVFPSSKIKTNKRRHN